MITDYASIKGFVSGRVQGVGFRYFAREQARALGVAGFARNLADGRVEFLVQGERAAVDTMLERIAEGPAHARVDRVDTEPATDEPAVAGFVIR